MFRSFHIRKFGLFITLFALCYLLYLIDVTTLWNGLILLAGSVGHTPESITRNSEFPLSILNNMSYSAAPPMEITTGSRMLPLYQKPCVPDKLNPWDESMEKYFNFRPKPFNCSIKGQLMHVDNRGLLQFNVTVLQFYNLKISDLKCSTRAMVRYHDDDKGVVYKSKKIVSLPAFVKSHFFRVTCTKLNNITVLYDYLHFNPFWNSDAKPMKKIENEDSSRLSILVFGLDSVSRSHAVRYLPKSYKFLLEQFQAYDFEGFSKVGDNTWPNAVPLLTGESYRKFPEVSSGQNHSDVMPLIWSEDAMKRVATMHAEDYPAISTFNYCKLGFRHQPTDYYYRPYTLGMKRIKCITPGTLEHGSQDHCYGGVSEFDTQINYFKGFLSRYYGKRKFAFLWNSRLSHDYFTSLSRGDESLLSFLVWMKTTGQLQNAIFLTLSDHGFRMGQVAMTTVGRKESHRPWLMMHVPKHVLQKYPWLHKVLSDNTERLITTYDVYQTMLNVINGNAFSRSPQIGVQNRTVRRNIFDPIPELRSCVDAGIELLFCKCQETVAIPISPTTDLVKNIADFLVNGINEILRGHTHSCQVLSLFRVTEAHVVYSKLDGIPTTKEERKENIAATGLYLIVFCTKPGNAYFEGTVELSIESASNSYHRMTMIGEPSRLDKFGNQSFCINDMSLKPFCYCKDLM